MRREAKLTQDKYERETQQMPTTKKKKPAKKTARPARKAAARPARKAAAKPRKAAAKPGKAAKPARKRRVAPGLGKTTPTSVLVAKHGKTDEEKALYRNEYLPGKRALSRAVFKGDAKAVDQLMEIAERAGRRAR